MSKHVLGIKKSYYERWSTNSHGSHAAANAIAASPLLFLWLNNRLLIACDTACCYYLKISSAHARTVAALVSADTNCISVLGSTAQQCGGRSRYLSLSFFLCSRQITPASPIDFLFTKAVICIGVVQCWCMHAMCASQPMSVDGYSLLYNTPMSSFFFTVSKIWP